MKFIPLILLVFVLGCNSVKINPSNNIMKKNNIELTDEFVVVAFGGPTLEYTNLERFREIADANIDIIVPGNQSDDGPSNLKALDLAEKAGIRVLTWDKRVCPMAVTTNVPIDYEVIQAMTDDYKNHPAFAGYVIRDEPDAGIFPRLSEMRQLYLEKDPVHEPLINLFPSYANDEQLASKGFQDYLDKFIRIVEPSIVSYDNYALLADRIATPEVKEKREEVYFNDLKIVGETTRKAGIPFWNFILSAGVNCEGKEYLRVPNRAEILWQANTTLAYGARGVCWFCCWTPKIATMPGALALDEEYFGGMINGDGTKNQMYNYLKEANAFLRKNGRRLIDWNCAFTARYKNGKIVNGESPAAIPSGKNFDLVIGTFTKGDKRCLVIANASYKRSAEFSLLPAEEFEKIKIFSTIDAKFDEEKEVWKLKPGGCAAMECINIAAAKSRE